MLGRHVIACAELLEHLAPHIGTRDEFGAIAGFSTLPRMRIGKGCRCATRNFVIDECAPYGRSRQAQPDTSALSDGPFRVPSQSEEPLESLEHVF